LENNVERLADDHANAERLARGLSQLPHIEIVSQATNMVFIKVTEKYADELNIHLEKNGIYADVRRSPAARLVTHLDISEGDVDKVVETVKTFFANV